MIEVYGLSINQLNPDLLNAENTDWMKRFSAYRMEKIIRCKNEKAKKQGIAAGYLLDYVLSLHGLREKTAVFHTNSYGKRLLSDADVNLSHSGNYVLCAYGDRPVGIDIERIRPDMEKIAKRFFTEAEYEWILQQEKKEEAFVRLWTLKESYVKQIGTGLNTPLNQFEIKLWPEIGVCEVGKERKRDCYFKEYVKEDYRIAVCACDNVFPKEIIFLTEID